MSKSTMRVISMEECKAVEAGVHINIGAAVGTLTVGAMTGPVGFGMALGGVVISVAVNGLVDLFRKKR